MNDPGIWNGKNLGQPSKSYKVKVTSTGKKNMQCKHLLLPLPPKFTVKKIYRYLSVNGTLNITGFQYTSSNIIYKEKLLSIKKIEFVFEERQKMSIDRPRRFRDDLGN